MPRTTRKRKSTSVVSNLEEDDVAMEDEPEVEATPTKRKTRPKKTPVSEKKAQAKDSQGESQAMELDEIVNFGKKTEVDTSIPPDQQMPFVVGDVLRVLALGTIEYGSDKYHNDRYIFPVGYKAERMYNSYMKPGTKIPYVSEIKRGENNEPSFVVTPSDDTNSHFAANTPTGAWSQVIKKIQVAAPRGEKRQNTTVSGPEFFGLSNPRVKLLIEMLPNIDKCANYKTFKKQKEAMDTGDDEDNDNEGDYVPEAEKLTNTGRPMRRAAKQASQSVSEVSKFETLEPKKRKRAERDDDDYMHYVHVTLPTKYPGLDSTKQLPQLDLHQWRYLAHHLAKYDGNDGYAELNKRYTVEVAEKLRVVPPKPTPQKPTTIPNPATPQTPAQQASQLVLQQLYQKGLTPQVLQAYQTYVKLMQQNPQVTQPPSLNPQVMALLQQHGGVVAIQQIIHQAKQAVAAIQQASLPATPAQPTTTTTTTTPSVQPPATPVKTEEQPSVAPTPEAPKADVKPEAAASTDSKPATTSTDATPSTDKKNEFKPLGTMWEFAYVCYCMNLVRPVLKICEFEPEDLEYALNYPEKSNGMLADIHVRLVKGPAIDKKGQGYMHPSNFHWMNVVKKKLDNINFRSFEVCPLEYSKYSELHPAWRVHILKALLDWKMENAQRVIEHLKKIEESNRFAPIGYDDKGNTYWYFGDEVGCLYKETAPETTLADNTNPNDGALVTAGKWEVVGDTPETIRQFAEAMELEENSDEADLHQYITSYILPSLEAFVAERTARRKTEKDDEELAKLEKPERVAKKCTLREQFLLQKAQQKEQHYEERAAQQEAKEKEKSSENVEYEKREAAVQQLHGMSRPPTRSAVANIMNNHPLDDVSQTIQESSDGNGETPSKGRVTRSGRRIALADYEDSEDETKKGDESEARPKKADKRRKKKNKGDDEDFILDDGNDDDEEEEEEEEEHEDDEHGKDYGSDDDGEPVKKKRRVPSYAGVRSAPSKQLGTPGRQGMGGVPAQAAQNLYNNYFQQFFKMFSDQLKQNPNIQVTNQLIQQLMQQVSQTQGTSSAVPMITPQMAMAAAMPGGMQGLMAGTNGAPQAATPLFQQQQQFAQQLQQMAATNLMQQQLSAQQQQQAFLTQQAALLQNPQALANRLVMQPSSNAQHIQQMAQKMASPMFKMAQQQPFAQPTFFQGPIMQHPQQTAMPQMPQQSPQQPKPVAMPHQVTPATSSQPAPPNSQDFTSFLNLDNSNSSDK